MRFTRLTREEIPHILARGRRAGGVFTTLFRGSEGTGDAVVVSKKVARTAAARNRLRRILRAALRTCSAGKGAWLVVVRAGATKATPGVLRGELSALYTRLSGS